MLKKCCRDRGSSDGDGDGSGNGECVVSNNNKEKTTEAAAKAVATTTTSNVDASDDVKHVNAVNHERSAVPTTFHGIHTRVSSVGSAARVAAADDKRKSTL